MPNRGLKPGVRPKRTRQTISLPKMVLDEIDEEEQTVETAPDHISTSASEASSMRSNSSQPPLLDFIGNTCMASAWFTSCFPCAVVDINDSDDYVVDKLSRQSAMNVMYANHNMNMNTDASNSISVTPDCSPISDGNHTQYVEDHVKNVMYVRLPEPGTTDVPLHSVPSVIEEDSHEDDVMDEISLNDDAGSMPVSVVSVAVTPQPMDSGIVDDREIPAVNEKPIYMPPKKKKFGMKKLFGRKKA